MSDDKDGLRTRQRAFVAQLDEEAAGIFRQALERIDVKPLAAATGLDERLIERMADPNAGRPVQLRLLLLAMRLSRGVALRTLGLIGDHFGLAVKPLRPVTQAEAHRALAEVVKKKALLGNLMGEVAEELGRPMADVELAFSCAGVEPVAAVRGEAETDGRRGRGGGLR
jgi:hypothetical protein